MDGLFMYESHFGFHRQPFQCSDSVHTFTESSSIREIISPLLHALRSDLGIAVLTAAPGAGRTTFLRHLLTHVANEGRPVLCSGASLGTSADLLQVLQLAAQKRAGEADLSHESGELRGVVRWQVLEQLRKSGEFWGPVFLLIDDAQLMPLNVLNDLRSMTEELRDGRSLVRCLISGPLSFEEELARPDHLDFNRRIRCHTILQPLTSRESVQFLERHLTAVGGELRKVITPTALEQILHACDGLPRCLSLLVDEAFVVAAEAGERQIDDSCVRKSLARLQHLPYSWSASPRDSLELLEPERSEQIAPQIKTPSESFRSGDSNVRQVVPAAPLGVVEFGAPSVVEFMAVPTPTAESEILKSEPESSEPADKFAPHWEFPEPVNFAASNAPAVAEVRSAPQLQNSDSLLAEDHSVETGSIEPWDQNGPLIDVTEVIELAEAPIPGQRETQSEKVQRDNAADSVSPRLPELHSGFSERVFVDGTGSRFGHSIPVVDRYTWLALGREVPSGTFAVSSSREMHRLSTGRHLSEVSGSVMRTAAGGSCVRTIPLMRTTDREIAELFCGKQNAEELQVISFPRPTDELSGNRIPEECHEVAEEELARAPLGVVGVEAFNAVDTDDKPLESPPGEIPAGHPEDIYSEQNRLAIEEAVRSTLAWSDGQLVFGRLAPDGDPGDPLNSLDLKDNAQPNEVPNVSIAEPLIPDAEDEAVESVHPIRPVGTFFTLPVDTRRIDWDLRSDLVHEDEILPLAKSVAELRNEVTTFQQGPADPGESAEKWLGGHNETVTVPYENLLTQARRRLDEQFAITGNLTAEPENSGSAIVPSPVPGDCGVNSEASLASKEVSGSARFSRLFTRVLQNRRKA